MLNNRPLFLCHLTFFTLFYSFTKQYCYYLIYQVFIPRLPFHFYCPITILIIIKMLIKNEVVYSVVHFASEKCFGVCSCNQALKSFGADNIVFE